MSDHDQLNLYKLDLTRIILHTIGRAGAGTGGPWPRNPGQHRHRSAGPVRCGPHSAAGQSRPGNGVPSGVPEEMTPHVSLRHPGGSHWGSEPGRLSAADSRLGDDGTRSGARDQLVTAVAERKIPAAASWRAAKKAGRRLTWGLSDQAMCSLTNFLL